MSDLKLTVSSWGEIALDKKEMRALMRAAGNSVRSKTAKLINQSQGGGRIYRYRDREGTYTASVPGAPPVRVSNKLRASLKTYAFKSGEGFAVRARQFYALFLEVGARGGGNRFGGRPGAAAAARGQTRRHRAKGVYTTRILEPRPFLDRVMQQEAPELNRRVRNAVTHVLTWKQTK
jgi:hypothetical protein